MIRLGKGLIGSAEGHALQDFEQVPVGPITGTVTFLGGDNSGGCSLGPATLGSR
jgi:hypothetical protein